MVDEANLRRIRREMAFYDAMGPLTRRAIDNAPKDFAIERVLRSVSLSTSNLDKLQDRHVARRLNEIIQETFHAPPESFFVEKRRRRA